MFRYLTVFLCLISFCATPAVADEIFDMRGDTGLLMDLKPTGVKWLNDELVFVVDEQWNAFHLFDLKGRRYRFVEFPKIKSPAFYAGVAELGPQEFFVTGSHYHPKNRERYVWQRSVIHRILLRGEEVGEDSVTENYSPDFGFRKTRLYGSSPKKNMNMEVSGIAFDKKQRRVFFSLRRPLNEKGEAILLVGNLDEFLERKERMEFEIVSTELKPPIESSCSTQTYVSDIEYIAGRGLVMLLTAEADGGFRFCSNQIWFMPAGLRKPKLVKENIAPGNRATGIALRVVDKWSYQAVLVCNNNPKESNIPSRMLLVDDIRLKLR